MFLRFVLLVSTIAFLPSLSFAKTLVISDSHSVGAFGKELASLIEKDRDSVDYYAFGGTQPIDWIQGNNLTWGYWEHHTGALLDRRGTNRSTPVLTSLLQKHKPNRVMIVQGTNMFWHEPGITDKYSIRYLMKAVQEAGAECVWIGPPDVYVKPSNEKNQWIDEIHRLIEQQAPDFGCKVIQSWTFTHYPAGQGDGIHYDKMGSKGEEMARQWARDAFSKLP